MTKRIPGAKRGRPKKPKLPAPPKREVGRPEIPLSVRPYRYALAYYEALVATGFGRRRLTRFLAMQKNPLSTLTDDGHIYVTSRFAAPAVGCTTSWITSDGQGRRGSHTHQVSDVISGALVALVP